jgi:hypothetical protein
MDKLIAVFAIRIPEKLKKALDNLPPSQKSKAIHDARITLARSIHDSKFNEKDYLGGEGDLS